MIFLSLLMIVMMGWCAAESVFVICWSPYFVWDLLQVYGFIPLSQSTIAISTFIQSLAPLNSAANPIIYYIFTTHFCRTIRWILYGSSCLRIWTRIRSWRSAIIFVSLFFSYMSRVKYLISLYSMILSFEISQSSLVTPPHHVPSHDPTMICNIKLWRDLDFLMGLPCESSSSSSDSSW